ncbi:MAG: hypothetical protein C4516_07740 [Oxalobacter sp.]|nr:MAG: hypothetical protein C4516_07740 [Oxalobacter sp.]
MKPQSQRTLLWLGLILLIVGGVILSPLASLLLAAIAALCALPTLFFGSGFQRLFALILLMSAIGLGVMHFGKGSGELQQYQRRAKVDKTSASPPAGKP